MSTVGRAMALKLPKGTLEFIRTNPTIASAVGQIVASGLELGIEPKLIREQLEHEKFLAAVSLHIENGTKEDLLDFLEKVKNSVDAPIDLGIMSEEQVKGVEQAMGSDRFAYTQVDSIGDKVESKEATT